ncbi:hypothetical protein HW132_00805 [Brasilonema sp. CT11]|nr:hypothetical protein [Brasilonema sp. CT11]
MKTNLTQDHHLLLKLACKGLRYFLLTLLGFAIAYIVSAVFGVTPVIKILQSPSLWQWFIRIATFIFCLFAIAIMLDSWR